MTGGQVADLGAVHGRLAPGLQQGWGSVVYTSPAEVLRDVRDVFNNARRFNPTNETVM
jgi:Bromodomain